MSSYGWTRLLGESIRDYQLISLVRAEPKTAIFGAKGTSTSSTVDAFVTLVNDGEENSELQRRRFMEAKFLRNPNLLTVYEVGRTIIQDKHCIFLATEAANSSLKFEEVPDSATVWLQAKNLISALAYLHSENFVYCAMRRETIWQVGDTWKLGDYTQLRLIGSGKSLETRTLLARLPEVPPEAYEGLVTPAWDVWSLGVTLGKILRGDTAGRRLGVPSQSRARPAPIPEHFDSIIRRCLDPDPSTRITIPGLAKIFSTPAPGLVHEEPVESESGTKPATSGPPATSLSEEAAVPSLGYRFDNSFASRRRIPRVWLIVAAILFVTAIALFAVRQQVGPGGDGHPVGIPTPNPISQSPRPDPVIATETKENVDPKRRIFALLDRWVASIRSRNLNEQVSCYAPVVETFYGKHNIKIQDMLGEKTRQFSSISKVRQFDLRNVRVRQISPTQATVLFRKNWDFGTFAGSERGELVVRAIKGEWKIASERGLKVYWVKRLRPQSKSSPG